MQFLSKHILLVANALIIAFLIFIGVQLLGSSARMLDFAFFIIFGVVLSVLPIMKVGQSLIDKLDELLKGRVGVESNQRGDDFSGRQAIEHSRYVLYPLICQAMDELSKLRPGFNAQVDKAFNLLHGAYWSETPAPADVAQLRSVMECTCGPNEGCSSCPKPSTGTAVAGAAGQHWGKLRADFGVAAGRVTVGCMEPHLVSTGAQADQRAEAEIVGKGLTAPRVTADHIQALMDKLAWSYEQPHGTTSTLAHAYLDGFYLVTGHSACVSPENFNAALGMKYAREQAEGKARDELWKLEGYALAKSLWVLPS